jgi:hypothetical protein
MWNDTKTSRENRQDRALERQANARSPQDQLKHLDDNGFVAKKERLKLAKKLMKKDGNALLEKMQTPQAKKAAKELFQTPAPTDNVVS